MLSRLESRHISSLMFVKRVLIKRVLVKRVFRRYSINYIARRSNDLPDAVASVLQPVAANLRRLGKTHGTAHPNSAYLAREREKTRDDPNANTAATLALSVPMATISNGRDLDLSVDANVKSIASGIICLYYFTT